MADTIVTTCGKILDAIRASSTVSAVKTAQFSAGTTISLFLGLDAKNLPAETELPWVAAIPQAFGRNDDYDHDEQQVTMAVAIKKAGMTGNAKTAYTALDGYPTLVAFCDAIASATETALVDNMLQLSDVNIDVDIPYYRASWSFRVPTEK